MDQFYTLLQMNFVISTDILCTNFNVCKNLSVFVYAVMMFSNSLCMIRTDQNMLEILVVVCKKCNFNSSAFVGFIV